MNSNDLTSGPILKKIMQIAIPIVFVNFIGMSNNIFSMFWLGFKGTSQLSAIGTGMMFITLAYAFSSLARTGTEVSISQAAGRHDHEDMIVLAHNGIRLSFLLAIIYTICLVLFTEQLIGLFTGLDEVTSQRAIAYLHFSSIGIFCRIILNTLYGIFAAIGRTKVISQIVGFGLIVNIILDPIMLFGFNLDVWGLGISYSISAFIMVTLLFYNLGRETTILKNFKLFNVDRKSICNILKISTPNAIQNMSINFISMIVASFVVVYGVEAIAAQRIGFNLESLTWMVTMGITTSMSIYIGQNYGAKEYGRMRNGFYLILKIMSMYAIVITIILIIGSEQLISVFSNDPKVIEIGVNYLKVLSITQVCMVFEGVCMGYFNGQGKTKISAFFSITGNLIRVPLAFYGSMFYGLDGVWYALAISAIYKGLTPFIVAEFMLRKQRRLELSIS
ncbi:MAG: MATE family efflux transporter [Mycoplasmatales bacterium]